MVVIIVGILRHGGVERFSCESISETGTEIRTHLSCSWTLATRLVCEAFFTFTSLCSHPRGLAAQEGHLAARVGTAGCWEPLPEVPFGFDPLLKN